MNWNDASAEMKFHAPEKAGQKRVYVSVDYFHGRLYYLMLKESLEKRLPYEFVYSPVREEVPGGMAAYRKAIEKRIHSCQLFLFICGYRVNEEEPGWERQNVPNRQNYELHIARQKDLPLLVVRPRVGLQFPEGLKGAQYMETKTLTGKSVEKLVEDGLKYW